MLWIPHGCLCQCSELQERQHIPASNCTTSLSASTEGFGAGIAAPEDSSGDGKVEKALLPLAGLIPSGFFIF